MFDPHVLSYRNAVIFLSLLIVALVANKAILKSHTFITPLIHIKASRIKLCPRGTQICAPEFHPDPRNGFGGYSDSSRYDTVPKRNGFVPLPVIISPSLVKIHQIL